jgi:hypothetical protein
VEILDKYEQTIQLDDPNAISLKYLAQEGSQ